MQAITKGLNNQGGQMNVTKMPLDKITEAPYNPRKMDKKVFKKLVENIRKNQVYSPLIVNERTSYVIGGNQRLRALRELCYTEAFVVLVNMSLEEEMAFNIALNKLVGEFDEPSLPAIFNALQTDQELLAGTGFDLQEVFQIIDMHTVHPVEEFDADKELSPGKNTVTKPGDIVQLAAHKIICADTARKENIALLLGDEKVNLLHMDLPYGCLYDPNNRPHSPQDRDQHSAASPIKNDDLIGEEYLSWLKEVLLAVAPFLSDGTSMYLWSGFRNFGPMTQLLMEMGFYVSNVIVWVKPSACPGFGHYKFASEFLLYVFPKGKGSRCWHGPKNETNVWEVDREEDCSALHPTVKPTSIARRVIRNSSKKGNIVFDGCAGVGFNLLACQQMGRIFRGCEIEPRYVDICVRRFVKMFGMDKVSPEIRHKYFEGGK